MNPLESYLVDDGFRDRVRATVARLGSVTLIAEPRWRPFAAQLDLFDDAEEAAVTTVAPASGVASFVVGTPAEVLRHARHECNDFGFVMPVARLLKPWQRGSQWRDDTTLDLWRAGWTPIAADRLLVAGDDATVEFVIGSARQTPAGPDA